LIRILRILILLLPIWAGNAFANKSDQDKPLIVNADQVDVDDVKQSYQLSGDVLLIKGSMIAKGDKGTILVDPQGYQNIDLKGRLEAPASMRQRREGLADEFMQGVGRDVSYDDKKELVMPLLNVYSICKCSINYRAGKLNMKTLKKATK